MKGCARWVRRRRRTTTTTTATDDNEVGDGVVVVVVVGLWFDGNSDELMDVWRGHRGKKGKKKVWLRLDR